MKLVNMKIALAVLLGGVSTVSFGQDLSQEKGLAYGPNDRYEQEIIRFEKRDKETPVRHGGIVFIGSSSMGYWNGTVTEDMAPLSVVPRGFGGSNMNDALHYIDRIVLPYEPRAVVLYEGENDVAQKVGPARIIQTYDQFVSTVHKALPNCRIYVLSIKPSPGRMTHWPRMEATNKLLKERADQNPLVTYVDVATPMLDQNGKPRRALFREDMIHMQRAGYVVWRDTLKPVLLSHELEFE